MLLCVHVLCTEHGSFVKRVVEGGAAGNTGQIHVDQRIVSVNGTSTLRTDKAGVVALIKASVGEITLQFQDDFQASLVCRSFSTGATPAGNTTQLPGYDAAMGSTCVSPVQFLAIVLFVAYSRCRLQRQTMTRHTDGSTSILYDACKRNSILFYSVSPRVFTD